MEEILRELIGYDQEHSDLCSVTETSRCDCPAEGYNIAKREIRDKMEEYGWGEDGEEVED